MDNLHDIWRIGLYKFFPAQVTRLRHLYAMHIPDLLKFTQIYREMQTSTS